MVGETSVMDEMRERGVMDVSGSTEMGEEAGESREETIVEGR